MIMRNNGILLTELLRLTHIQIPIKRVLTIWEVHPNTRGLNSFVDTLNELGIENAYNLTGGILAWNGDIVAP